MKEWKRLFPSEPQLPRPEDITEQDRADADFLLRAHREVGTALPQVGAYEPERVYVSVTPEERQAMGRDRLEKLRKEHHTAEVIGKVGWVVQRLGIVLGAMGLVAFAAEKAADVDDETAGRTAKVVTTSLVTAVMARRTVHAAKSTAEDMVRYAVSAAFPSGRYTVTDPIPDWVVLHADEWDRKILANDIAENGSDAQRAQLPELRGVDHA